MFTVTQQITTATCVLAIVFKVVQQVKMISWNVNAWTVVQHIHTQEDNMKWAEVR